MPPAPRTRHKFSARRPFLSFGLTSLSAVFGKEMACSLSFFMSVLVSTLGHGGARVALTDSILYCVAGRN